MRVQLDKRKLIQGIIIVLFLLTLYWVEFSSWSSRALSAYNQGYGTFDMKRYDVSTVTEVLAVTSPMGITIYHRYLIGDYLFILAFGALQIMISYNVYKVFNKRPPLLFAIAVPVVRGVADFVENTMIECILLSNPNVSVWQIQCAMIATRIKLVCIAVWGILVVSGLLYRRINHH